MAMLCHCHVVADRVIADVVARGAGSLADVEAHCGAGGSCGGCIPAIEALLEQQAESFQQQTLLNMKLLEALEKLSSK